MSSATHPVVLDRDGVINVDVPGQYVCSVEQWVPIDGSLEAIGELTRAGFAVYVVSNQSGIGRGYFGEDVLAQMHQKLIDAAMRFDGVIAGWFYCPHTPDENCDCRKPKTGLLDKVCEHSGVSLERVPFIGDKLSDMQAAQAKDMRGMLVGTGHGSAALAAHAGRINEYFVDLHHAVQALTRGRPGISA